MRAPQGLGLKLRKYKVDNTQAGSDIINANLNPIVINDTTAATTTANSYTQVKSYSGIGGVKNYYGKYMVNAIRIQVYGYVSAGTGYVEIEVDGSTSYTVLKAITGAATGTSFTNTSSALLIDAIIELDPSTSHTITINAYNSTSGDSTTISSVYGFQGYALTATSLTQIDSETLQNHILDQIGFSYNGMSGVSAQAFVNRSTTATATLQLSDNFTPSGQYHFALSAPTGNDPANAGYWMIISNNGNDSIPIGYNGTWSWTASGEVGAGGDVLLIGNLYIWFGINSITQPNSDFFATVFVHEFIPPGQSANVQIWKQVPIPLNNCSSGSLICVTSSQTLMSGSNSGSASSPSLTTFSGISQYLPLTTDELVYFNGGIQMFIEIEATVI